MDFKNSQRLAFSQNCDFCNRTEIGLNFLSPIGNKSGYPVRAEKIGPGRAVRMASPG